MKNIVLVGMLLTFVAVILTNGCGQKTGVVDQADIDQVYVGMDIAEVIRFLGKPCKTKETPHPYLALIYKTKTDAYLFLVDDSTPGGHCVVGIEKGINDVYPSKEVEVIITKESIRFIRSEGPWETSSD